MEPATRTAAHSDGFFALMLPFGLIFTLSASPALAGGCAFEPQGEGRVAAVIDARSFRLADGREIRLAGIEPAVSTTTGRARTAALSAIIAGHDVTLHGQDDAPDRYGRQVAFVFLGSSENLVQGLLLSQGEVLVSAEAEARQAKRGTWADASVIKSAESPDDILTGIGRFTVVEGKVLSVRQAGATTYLNFGRNWTQDFAATISRRMTPAIEAAGLTIKSLENKRIRVRGFVEARGGPRIEVLRAGQIEVLGVN